MNKAEVVIVLAGIIMLLVFVWFIDAMTVQMDDGQKQYNWQVCQATHGRECNG